MDTWRKPERAQERRFWGTLALIGAVLVLVLLASILLTARASGAEPSTWFYVQQASLLALSVVGTAIAFRRRRQLRVRADEPSRY